MCSLGFCSPAAGGGAWVHRTAGELRRNRETFTLKFETSRLFFLIISFRNISEPVSSPPTSALEVFFFFSPSHERLLNTCAAHPFICAVTFFEVIWFGDFVRWKHVQSCWKLDAKWNNEDEEDENRLDNKIRRPCGEVHFTLGMQRR